jgi:hypothetical protein
MENDNLQFMKTSSDEPRWKGVVDVNDILSKIGPEGCYELADKLEEIADEDMRIGLEQAEEELNKNN